MNLESTVKKILPRTPGLLAVVVFFFVFFWGTGAASASTLSGSISVPSDNFRVQSLSDQYIRFYSGNSSSYLGNITISGPMTASGNVSLPYDNFKLQASGNSIDFYSGDNIVGNTSNVYKGSLTVFGGTVSGTIDCPTGNYVVWGSGNRLYSDCNGSNQSITFTDATPTGWISASPNPCSATSPNQQCGTTISWGSSNTVTPRVYVYSPVSYPAGQFFAGGASGSVNVPWIKVGETFTFRLYSNVESGQLDSVSVTMAPPTVNISGTSPASPMAYNTSPGIFYTSTGATYCNIYRGGVLALSNRSYSEQPSPGVGNLTSNTTLTVTCYNNAGQSGSANTTAIVSAPPTYTLSVSKNGTGAGTVTSNPAGVSCGADCSQSYTSGTGVTLSASPAVGSVFAGWSGDADCSNGSVTMNADRSCTATFNNAPPTIDSATISSPTVTPDNTTQYTIAVSGSDASGAGSVTQEYALVNYQGGNAGSYRGYLSWSNANSWPSIKDNRACTGGGYAGIQPGYGDTYLRLDSCTTVAAGNTRTTSFVVRFDPSFTTPLTGNDISGLVYDNLGQSAGWTNFDTNFSLIYNNASCGAVTLPNTTFAPGEAFTATVAVNNTGTKTWTTDATPHRLGNSGTWGAGGRVELPSPSVNPGAGTTFTINATAPATPGTYDFSWQMVEDGVQWFGPVCSAPSQVTVAEPVPAVTLTPQTTLGGTTGSAFYGEYDGAWGGVVTNISWSGTNSPTSCVVYRDGIAVSGVLAYPGTAQYNIPWAERIEATTTYRVDCTNSGGTGQSNTVTFTVPPPLTNPTYTCGPAGTTVDLGWTPPGGYIGNFIRGHQDPPAWTGSCTGTELCVTDGANPYSWSITPGTTYSWWAHNRIADGNWSNGMWGTSFSCTPATYALNVAKDGAGSGIVTGSNALSLPDIDCGSTCSLSYPWGTLVQLTATPTGGGSFTGWSGACTGSGTCFVTIDAIKNVTATFASAPPAGTISANPIEVDYQATTTIIWEVTEDGSLECGVKTGLTNFEWPGVSGAKETPPLTTSTTYRLVCGETPEQLLDSVEVIVNSTPTLTPSAQTVAPPGQVTFTVERRGQTGCNLINARSGDVLQPDVPDGTSNPVTVSAATWYKLECVSGGESAEVKIEIVPETSDS